MVSIEIPSFLLFKLQPFHRFLQFLCWYIPNHNLKTLPKRIIPEYVFGWEGGVVVNDKNILIRNTTICDENGGIEESVEEQEVLNVLKMICSYCEQANSEDILNIFAGLFIKYKIQVDCQEVLSPGGDPLRALFR